MISTAEFSKDRKYRYSLTRIWDNTKPLMAFCMLNPSTADEKTNDPTVERCQRRAMKLGFGGLIVVNIFAYRSTDPEELYTVDNPIGQDNLQAISNAATAVEMFVCGWGKHGKLENRGNEVIQILKSFKVIPYALKINKDGTPAHPLYIGYKVKPKKIER